jgi:arginase
MKLELIVVPYDVDRDDTAAARAPRELLARGFEDALAAGGWEVRKSLVWSRAETGKEAIVASVARETARLVARARGRGRFPLILSGGCLTGVGVTAGLQRLGRQVYILWVDAHGDFNTPESSPSGYWDGMALAAVCGRSLAEVYRRAELRPVHYQKIALLGGRALDPPEVEDFARLKVLLIPPEAVAGEEAVPGLRDRLGEAQELYLHIDLDGLDPRDAPGVNFPEPNGIPLADLLSCLGRLSPPTALTLAGMNFERVDDERRERMVANTLRLVLATLAPVLAPGGREGDPTAEGS